MLILKTVTKRVDGGAVRKKLTVMSFIENTATFIMPPPLDSR